MVNNQLGNMLVRLNLISQADLQNALEVQKNSGVSGNSNLILSDILLRNRYLTKEQLIPVWEYLTGATHLDLKEQTIDPAAVRMVSERVARTSKLIPIALEIGKIVLVMADPMDIRAQDDVRLITGLEPRVHFGFWDEVERAINRNYTSSELAEQAIEEIEGEVFEEEGPTLVAEEDAEVSRAPVVRLINSILEQAVRTKTSDIHIEALEKMVKIRLRVDGDLKEVMTVPKSSHAALIARVKIMSNLNIAEKRVPQDGRTEVRVLDKPIDLRISILPTVYGEKVVMRILDRASILVTKEQLGFTQHNISLFDKIIQAPEGIILISGPTGSGKTTTLYSVLRELNKPNLNIITVEDPVEYRLEGIHQVQVNPKAGLTFAVGLRSILRQDPDIIMIGEIRDAETAEIAARAAITGHVVLSTIHTNDTVSTVTRLADMGIEVYMVASSLVGVIAQRLVKRICTSCKRPVPANDQERMIFGDQAPAMFYHGEGCNICGGTGYAGRIAIHEVLVLDRELRAMITKGEHADDIKAKAQEKGLKTLSQTCRELVLSGVTTTDELLRVAYNIDD